MQREIVVGTVRIVITYLDGRIRDSNSVIKCLRTIFFEEAIPIADAIVSPVNEDSNTTNPP